MKECKGSILLVDDDLDIRSLLKDFLGREGYNVRTFSSAEDALAELRQHLAQGEERGGFDLVISDLKMAQMGGLEFLATLKAEMPDLPVILVTGDGTVDSAIEAMRAGAFHYIVKPFKLAEVALYVERAMERCHLDLDVRALRQELKETWTYQDILGKSPEMKTVFDLIARVANSTANVLIQGESGTGKEVVARAIHSTGNRSQKPFVAINCTAIPETLLESELFGHAKGSFTGAQSKKRGLIEEANGGTLFLDEIGDMSPVLQAKLLRVLQEKRIRPVGDNQMVDVDVRIISATHKNLKAAIAAGEFREDLFYRLSVIPICIPPLRKRTQDIPLLVEHFLRKFNAANPMEGTRRVRGVSKGALSKLLALPWPGNVRELENLIERAVVLCADSQIKESDIPDAEPVTAQAALEILGSDFPPLSKLEERYIQTVLKKTGDRKDRASQILGINRRTLYRKEREYGWVEKRDDQVCRPELSEARSGDREVTKMEELETL